MTFVYVIINGNLQYEAVVPKKIKTTSSIEIFLSYNISKSGRKKTKNKCSSPKRMPKQIKKWKKINFLTLTGNMMTSLHPINTNDAWIHIDVLYSFRICNKKWGYPGILKSYGRLKNTMFWAYFVHKCP